MKELWPLQIRRFEEAMQVQTDMQLGAQAHKPWSLTDTQLRAHARTCMCVEPKLDLSCLRPIEGIFSKNYKRGHVL